MTERFALGPGLAAVGIMLGAVLTLLPSPRAPPMPRTRRSRGSTGVSAAC